jgi:hypothetical protein
MKITIFAAIGFGVEPVTTDIHIAVLEVVLGREFVVNRCVQHVAIPAAAVFRWLLLPPDRPDTAGWQWFALRPAIGGRAARYNPPSSPGISTMASATERERPQRSCVVVD